MNDIELNRMEQCFVDSMMGDPLHSRLEQICEDLATSDVVQQHKGYVTVQVTTAIIEVARRTMKEIEG